MESKFIEFVGIGGTGKSSLEAEIRRQLSEKNIPVIKFSELKPGFKVKVISCVKALKYILKFSKLNISFLVDNLRILTVYFSKSSLASKYNGVVLLDEGIFHKTMILSRQSRKYSYKELINLMDNDIVTPYSILVLVAEPEVIFNRRKKRNRPGDYFTYRSIYEESILFNNIVKYIKQIVDGLNYETLLIIKDYNGENDVVCIAEDLVGVLYECNNLN